MEIGTETPWADGPREILEHAIALVHTETDTNRRIAMILVDNAVEQMVKTYLSLPKRISGLAISRKRREQLSESFPALLDALEEFASDKLDGIDLGMVEWYHRLRNDLYHQGFGLTVRRTHVEVYGELANILYKNLFGSALLQRPLSDDADSLGRLLELWNGLDAALQALSAGERGPVDRPGMIRDLGSRSLISVQDQESLSRLRQLRNRVVHGQVDYREAISKSDLERLEDLLEKYSGLAPSESAGVFLTPAGRPSGKTPGTQRDLPGRAGKAWNDDEDARLCSRFAGGAEILVLAGIHRRTKGAIRARLIKLGKIESESQEEQKPNQPIQPTGSAGG